MASTSRVRATANGDTTEVQALIQHPMDSGYVKDAKGELIPAHFIQQLTFECNGKSVFIADWGTAVSKDPYVKFSFKGGNKGDDLKVAWTDNKGEGRTRLTRWPRLREGITLRTATQIVLAALALVTLAWSAAPATAADSVDPVADAKAFQNILRPQIPQAEAGGHFRLQQQALHRLNEDMHRQWVEKEEFPPYEFSLDAGKEMFSKPFKNGKTYADCFPDKGIGIRQNYPYFDDEGKAAVDARDYWR